MTRMVVQGHLVKPAICFSALVTYSFNALVTYRPVKNWVSHSLDTSQITSCLDSKLLLIFMNQNFQFMTFTLANDDFIV